MTKKLEHTHLRDIHSVRYLQICDLVNDITGYDSDLSTYIGRENNAWKLLVGFCDANTVYESVQEIEKFTDSQIRSYFNRDYPVKRSFLQKLKSFFC